MQLIKPNKQHGFTLIELLIALVVVAIGALGHAKMQINSMRDAQKASFAQSSNIALHDLAQRMRAMPNAALNDEFTYTNLSDGSAPTSAKNCNADGISCNRSEFALFELADWYDDIDANLPDPRFAITRTNSLFTLTLIWDANKSGSDTSSCDATGTTNQCGVVNIWIR